MARGAAEEAAEREPSRSPSEADVSDGTGHRAVGALVGLAVGDAVGTALEFKSSGSFTPITDMVGGGPSRLPVGACTDVTSMAMCLAESIVGHR